MSFIRGIPVQAVQPQGTSGRVATVLLAALLAMLALHTVGAVLDFAAAIRFPYEIDYGEGIVWQQAVLIPGPRMYSKSTALPFIVFHYPPLFYLLVHAMRLIQPDFLAAGRTISALCAVLIVPSVVGLVLLVTARPGIRPTARDAAIAVMAGLLALCLHAVRTWGLVMRVDLVAVMLCTAGLLVGAWADGRFWGTTLALLLCVAGVYGKQTQLAAGIAVGVFALVRNPRGGLGAVAVAGGAGLAVLGLMQWLTDGGFVQNIIGSNINRWGGLRRALWNLKDETSSIPVIILAACAWAWVARSVVGGAPLRMVSLPTAVSAWRRASPVTARRALLLLHFALSTLMLGTVFKAGANFNYMLELLCAGVVLIGVMLVDLSRAATKPGIAFPAVVAVLLLTVSVQHVRQATGFESPVVLARNAALVERIRAADKPVASEDMTLLMRAGKPVLFEASIVTELAMVGRWDEAPLIQMIRNKGFAFMLITTGPPGGTDRRTPAVDAAIREAYPQVEEAGPDFLLRSPVN